MSRTLLLGGLVVGLVLASACGAKLVPVVVVLPLKHDISAWVNDDEVCVTLPSPEQVYVRYRCMSMSAIRSVILSTRSADEP